MILYTISINSKIIHRCIILVNYKPQPHFVKSNFPTKVSDVRTCSAFILANQLYAVLDKISFSGMYSPIASGEMSIYVFFNNLSIVINLFDVLNEKSG